MASALVEGLRTALQPGMLPSHEHNRQAWDERARQRLRHTRTAGPKELQDPLRALDPQGWLGGDLRGRRVLGLACGGGLQSVLCAKAGGLATVVDLSAEMLALDRQVAADLGLTVTTVQASMDDLAALGAASFDVVMQPVSTCYVPDIAAVFREVARVLAPGGLYISQHKQPVNLQASAMPGLGGYAVTEPYYRTGPLPPLPGDWEHREGDTLEYVHRWEDLLGGLCRAGFVIEDVVEPRHADPHAPVGSFRHRSCFIPPYVKLKARRVGPAGPARVLWMP
jgi:SAM-dependent methyltransferase